MTGCWHPRIPSPRSRRSSPRPSATARRWPRSPTASGRRRPGRRPSGAPTCRCCSSPPPARPTGRRCARPATRPPTTTSTTTTSGGWPSASSSTSISPPRAPAPRRRRPRDAGSPPTKISPAPAFRCRSPRRASISVQNRDLARIAEEEVKSTRKWMTFSAAAYTSGTGRGARRARGGGRLPPRQEGLLRSPPRRLPGQGGPRARDRGALMFDRLFGLLFGRRWLVLSIYAVAVPIAAWLCSRIKLDSNLLNLLPADIPAVKTVRKLESWSGGGALQFMYLGLVRDDRTSLPDLKRFAEAVGSELDKSRWIKGPISVGVDVTAIRKAAPLFLDPADLGTLGGRLDTQVTALRKQRSGFFLDLEDKPAPLKLDDILPKYQQRFQWGSGPGAATPSAMLARIRAPHQPGRHAPLLPVARRQDADLLLQSRVPARPAGPLPGVRRPTSTARSHGAAPRSRARRRSRSTRAAPIPCSGTSATRPCATRIRSTFWAGLIILCIDLLTVRRPRSTMMVYLSLATGLAVTFAISYLVIGTVNVITAFLLAILAGLGVDFGYYFSTRFNLFARAGLSRDAAVREAWTQTAVPAAMGALTTMAVMVILAFGRFRGFAELGIICSIGIVSIYVAMYTLCPALFLRFAQGGPGDRQRARGPRDRRPRRHSTDPAPAPRLSPGSTRPGAGRAARARGRRAGDDRFRAVRPPRALRLHGRRADGQEPEVAGDRSADPRPLRRERRPDHHARRHRGARPPHPRLLPAALRRLREHRPLRVGLHLRNPDRRPDRRPREHGPPPPRARAAPEARSPIPTCSSR